MNKGRKERQNSFLKGKPWEKTQSVMPKLFVWTFLPKIISKLIITNPFQQKLSVLINVSHTTSHKTVLKNSWADSVLNQIIIWNSFQKNPLPEDT